MRGGWWTWMRGVLTLLTGMLLACHGQLPLDALDDTSFFRLTAILVSPGPQLDAGVPGEVTLEVTVVYLEDFSGVSGSYFFKGLERAWPERAGVAVDEGGLEGYPCAPEDVPQPLVDGRAAAHVGGHWSCVRQRVTLRADAQALPGRQTMQFTAAWRAERDAGVVIQQVAEVDIGFGAAPDPSRFGLAVDAQTVSHPAGVDDLRTVRLTRADGSADPIALEFVDTGGSGLSGRFYPNPATGGESRLSISAPSSLAHGGRFAAAVRGTRNGKSVEVEVELVLASLFTFRQPEQAGATFSNPALIPIVISAPLAGPGQLHLSLSGLPDGATGRFEPDADLDFDAAGAPPTLTRTLRISVADPGLTGSDFIHIRATVGAGPEAPFIERAVLLRIAADPLPDWQFFAGRVPDTTDGPLSIGLAMRSDDQPVVAQLESPFDDVPTAHPNHVVVTRFDGVGWLPEPAGPVGPVGAPGSASFALGSGDVPMVAYTDAGGSQLNVVTLNAGLWAPSGNLRGVALPVARTPRLACGAGGQCALAWVEQDDPLTGSDLVVKHQASRLGGWALRAGPNPRRSLNRDPAGQVQPGSVALAIDDNGHLAVAWSEVPAAGVTPGLWMRLDDGAGWSAALALPAVAPTLASRVRLARDRAGTVTAFWTEGSPARLQAARYTAAGGWQRLANPITADGALNVVDGAAASDFSIALEADGNPVVAWAEGGLKPDIWAKRWNVNTWQWIGGSVDGSLKAAVAPQIAVDSRRVPYVAFTLYSRFDNDLTTQNPITEIQVARWR